MAIVKVSPIPPPVPLKLAVALVNVTLVVGGGGLREQVDAQTSGLSTIHSADACRGALAGSLMGMENNQPAVVFEILSIQEPRV
jgi:hypothetical protein